MRTVFASVCLAGLVVLVFSNVALGQSITGGCTASINGRAPSSMTQSDPLVVHKGDSVAVTGTVPASVGGGNPQAITSTTGIDIYLIDPLFKYSSGVLHGGHGPTWGDTVNPETYLKWGSGLYHAVGTATITGPAGTAICKADGYIKFDGGKLIEAVAGGVALVGGAGGALSVGRKPSSVTADEFGKGLVTDFIDQPTGAGPAVPATTNIERDSYPFCCMIAMLAVPLVAIGVVGGGGGGSMEEPPQPPPPSGGRPAPGTVLAVKRVYKHGHPIVGLIAGLFCWLGITIVLQQAGVWPLNTWTGIVLPVGGAVLTAVRARIGRPYKIVKRAA